MTLWQGIVLGLVQGLTEFLPVSSSGHLRVLEVATGVHTPGVFVEVALHVATLGSVLVVYGARLWAIVRGVLARRPAELRAAGLLGLATLPAGVIGVAFHRQVEAAASLLLVGAGFIVTGFMNWSTRRRAGARPEPTVGVASHGRQRGRRRRRAPRGELRARVRERDLVDPFSRGPAPARPLLPLRAV